MAATERNEESFCGLDYYLTEGCEMNKLKKTCFRTELNRVSDFFIRGRRS